MGDNSSVACFVCKSRTNVICSPNCVFARHFTSRKSEEFQDINNHFGLINAIKLIAKVPEDRKDEAMESMIFEAQMRRKHPVLGTLAVQAELKEEIRTAMEELVRVEKHLKLLRSTKTLAQQKEQEEEGSSSTSKANKPMGADEKVDDEEED